MTLPSARKSPATTRSGLRAAEPADVVDRRRSIGADRLAQLPGQRVLPVGVTHVVDGWQPLCGEGRVRFVFPGCTLDDAAEVCDTCASGGARRVPRQRRASSA